MVYFLELTEVPAQKFTELIDQIPSNLKKKFMSTYDMIVNKGIEKGIEKVILNGAAKGIPLEILSTITGLTVVEIKEVIARNKRLEQH